MSNEILNEQRFKILERKISYLYQLLEIPEFVADLTGDNIKEVDIMRARENIETPAK